MQKRKEFGAFDWNYLIRLGRDGILNNLNKQYK